MSRRYAVYDVFTDRRLAGNPLAVVFDAEGLDEVGAQAGDVVTDAARSELAESGQILADLRGVEMEPLRHLA